jgi:F-type H+-transporting ATPase subunit b
MQIINTTALITINETAVVQLISFLLFLFIINRVMLRPLRKTMGERDSYMDKMKQDTIAAEEKLLDYTRQIEKRRDKVKTEAFAVIRELEESGRTQAHEIFVSAGQEINALREKAEKEISAQIGDARKSIFAEAEPLAVCMMEQVLARRLSQ